MRIRKQASKLLGWAYCSPPLLPSSPSPPRAAAQRCWPALPAESHSGELHCQLNLSPWDAIDSPHCTNSQEDLEIENEEAEEEFEFIEKEDGGRGEEEKEAEVRNREERKEEKGRERKMRQAEPETEFTGTKCKKTDGKGWHCKRAAQLPHSLCSYHLAQLRSYRTRHEEQVSSVSGGSGNRRKKPAAAVNAGGASSNYYYYYSILGPWWGKRRGPIDGKESSESDVDREATADGDDDEKDVDGRQYNDGGVGCGKKRPVKKRGRKPMKARSLKSLL